MRQPFNILFLMLFSILISCNPSKEENEPKYATKTGEEGGYAYEYVTSDPSNTRIYTLDNGLKVYLSVYKDAPRAHVFMPVKAGGKNDPASNTGLAHYLEHMMFKGTEAFGTLDYEKEEPLLDSVESMFNTYAKLTDDQERKDYYKQIDLVSGEAAKFAIPNEYDKMISAIGGKGLNAYTTNDRTVYTVDIPSNEMDKFLEIEGSRFRKIVNRLFHTELEAVYEEKNRSLDNDGWKAYEAMYELAFQEHPYGTQTVIGTIDHLKNPSITEIKKYFNTYYRPNNMAICISGDIDPTETIKIVDKYFGNWEPNKELKPLEKIEEKPITEPRVAEVFGPDADNVSLAFRFGGTSDPNYAMVTLVDMMLSNSEAGLIDLNLKQQQKVLNAGSYVDNMNDYSLHTFYGEPKDGQTLEEVQQLILDQIELIKKGEFDDWLIDAVVTDMKKGKMQELENNWSRANDMVMAFTNGIPWEEHIALMDKIEAITKEQVMEFVKQNYKNNYVVVYKHNGEDPNKQHVDKPFITKVPVNRDAQSDFYKKLEEKKSPQLKPVFVDYEKDIAKTKTKTGIEILSIENKENELFNLILLLDIGSDNDPAMKVAVEYLEFLGTDSLNAEEFKKEFYKIGCSMNVYASGDRTYITLSGLDENMEKSLALFEDLLHHAKPDQEALDEFIKRELKAREDAKKNKSTILFSGLMSYGQYGAESSFTNVLSNAELQALQASDLTKKINDLTTMEHSILYYGPRSIDDVKKVINEGHKVPEKLTPLPEPVEFAQASTEKPKVYWTNYDMVQTEFIMLAKGNQYDKSIAPEVRAFNEYFGALVFQEIREAEGLAYSVFSSYSTPSKSDKDDVLLAYVGTQADKQSEAMAAINNLLDNMPQSAGDFEVAKKAILSKIESERITKSSILWNYENAKRLDLDYDIRKDVYNKVQNMTFDDLKKFHDEYVKNQSYVTVLIGNKDKINFEDLKNYGEVEELSLEDIFGYGKVEKVDLEME
ncbi:M16 family metallopeptidase [Fulvivirga ligni]|uniref:M16 family metallopeptidase n=1 Tax=Fulvivirga ligni TaxID=2904246 RepID=UPI001F177368|nr:insulinase family protein [Fulvivirga ligni]UII22604.1 insulinase family protein [Fulvivirga ligni]